MMKIENDGVVNITTLVSESCFLLFSGILNGLITNVTYTHLVMMMKRMNVSKMQIWNFHLDVDLAIIASRRLVLSTLSHHISINQPT